MGEVEIGVLPVLLAERGHDRADDPSVSRSFCVRSLRLRSQLQLKSPMASVISPEPR
jgi:hypothetical protein